MSTPAPIPAPPAHTRSRAGLPTCGARTRTGGRCANTFISANGRCRMHNGPALSGPAAPGYRHGRYSRALGAPLRARYEEALGAADRLSLADDVAVTEARIDELLTALSAEGGVTVAALVDGVTRAREAFREMREANARGDGPAVAQAATTLGRALDADLGALVARVQAQERQWTQVFVAQNHKRRLVATEHKRALALAQVLTLEQAHALFARLTDLVSTHVSDVRERRAIADGLVLLLGRSDGGPAQGGDRSGR